MENGFAVRGRFCQTDIARDHGAEDAVRKIAVQFVKDVVGELVTLVVHGDERAQHAQSWIQIFPHQGNRFHESSQPFERIILRLHGNEHLVRTHQRIDGKQPERGRAVNDDVIKLMPGLLKRIAEPVFAAFQIHQFNSGARERRRRRSEFVAFNRSRAHDLLQRRGTGERFVNPLRLRMVIHAKRARGIPLRIEIDEQYEFPQVRQIRGQIHGGRGIVGNKGSPPCNKIMRTGNREIIHISFVMLLPYLLHSIPKNIRICQRC